MAERKETGHAQDAKDRSSEAHSERILDNPSDTDNSDVGPNATETQRATEVQSLVDLLRGR